LRADRKVLSFEKGFVKLDFQALVVVIGIPFIKNAPSIKNASGKKYEKKYRRRILWIPL